MENIQFNSSTHRIVVYKGKPVALPLLTYWKLKSLNPDTTVVIQHTLGQAANENKYEKVKVSELSEMGI